MVVVRELKPGEVEFVDEQLPLNRLDDSGGDRSTYLIAWEEHRPVGHAHVAWRGTHLGLPEIQDVFVAPDRRRRGIATLLTGAAEEAARSRGCLSISLSVSKDGNPHARRLYEGLGYADAGVEPVRVSGTIMLRGRPFDVDDTLLYLRKALTIQPMRDHRFTPESYLAMMREAVPGYDRLEDETVAATGAGDARSVLELGTGTGETSRRVLDRHPGARLVGIDASPDMIEVARDVLPADRVSLLVRRLEDPLPEGPFDLVVSALAVHHLDASAKAELFRRIADALDPGGRFVLADVVEPIDPSYVVTAIDPEVDHPSKLDEQLAWLEAAGISPEVTWTHRDLVVIVGTARR